MFPSVPIFAALSQPFKRSQLGLFQGKSKQYGNNVPFSKHKTRRTWLPNVQRKRLFSDTLGESVRVKVTTRALKTIKKYGGLDNYVMKSPAKILGFEGMRLRLLIRDHAEAKAAEGEKVKAPHELGTKPPTLEDAHQLRLEAMKALNLSSLPDAQQTIAYLNQRRQAMHSVLSS